VPKGANLGTGNIVNDVFAVSGQAIANLPMPGKAIAAS
jgi:hypothetical protein